MIYIDTSVLVPLIVHEATSNRARAWRDGLNGRQRRELVISTWGLAEFSSAMGLKVRSREISPVQARTALTMLEEIVVPGLEVLEVASTDFRMADTLLREFSLGLRAGDALHLATASRCNARLIVALDRKLTSAAVAIGMSVAEI